MICDLHTGVGQLAQALSELKDHWSDAKTHWNDETSREFEQTFLGELPGRLQQVVLAAQRLNEVGLVLPAEDRVLSRQVGLKGHVDRRIGSELPEDNRIPQADQVAANAVDPEGEALGDSRVAAAVIRRSLEHGSATRKPGDWSSTGGSLPRRKPANMRPRAF